MIKRIKENVHISAATIVMFATLLLGTANAGFDDKIEHFFDPEPLPIDIQMNPSSLNGTYKIDRLVINENGQSILDSDNDYVVTEDRGEMSIRLNLSDDTINMTLKMQMTGPAFNKNSALAQYSYIYQNITVDLQTPESSKTIEEKLINTGLHVYGHDKLVWEIPLEGNKTIVLILEKESDRIKNIFNSKYLFL